MANPRTNKEEQIIREHFPTKGANGVGAMIPGRSLSTIRRWAVELNVEYVHKRKYGPHEDPTYEQIEAAKAEILEAKRGKAVYEH